MDICKAKHVNSHTYCITLRLLCQAILCIYIFMNKFHKCIITFVYILIKHIIKHQFIIKAKIRINFSINFCNFEQNNKVQNSTQFTKFI